jgi:DNA-binding FrmR family transcriptional regulator
MAHIIHDKTKLLNRVRRIRGQIDAIDRAIEEGAADECTAVMQLIAAARGAMDGLMAAVLEGHVRFHMIDPDRNPTSSESRAAQELIDVVKAYLK